MKLLSIIFCSIFAIFSYDTNLSKKILTKNTNINHNNKVIITKKLPNPINLRNHNCTQEFRFFFKNKHDNVFWIGENKYGECGESNLIQIYIDENNNKSYAKHTELKDFDNWAWITKAKESIKIEDVIMQKGENGQILFPAMELSILPPLENPKLQNLKDNHYKNECAKVWNNLLGNEGIDLPMMIGLNSKLIYHYNEGLYFNYSIESVYIFPSSRYLILFTKNKNVCNGENSTHGFMIFKFEVLK
jgi:hypothetical protein